MTTGNKKLTQALKCRAFKFAFHLDLTIRVLKAKIIFNERVVMQKNPKTTNNFYVLEHTVP